VRLRRREEEDDMLGRLLKGFQQSIESLRGQHVHFIDDVHLVAAFGRTVPNSLPQLADAVDSTVGGTVNFEHVHRMALSDLPAVRADIAGGYREARLAVEALGQDARHRGFPDAAGSREKVGMSDATCADCILQGTRHMSLPHHLIERLGAPFPGKDKVRDNGPAGQKLE